MAVSRFKFEREFLQQGKRRIAGVDEAGRGPLAGPVVCAAVIFPTGWIQNGVPGKLRGLNDSKQLSVEQREEFFAFLTGCGEVEFGISIVSVEVIDRINILQASLRGMNEAVTQLALQPDHTLVDGPHISSARHSQTPLVDGDARSYSIAAASVLAKVTRDRLMAQYDVEFPGYGFAEHKGYSTPRHLQALTELGPCAIHRRSFAPVRGQEPTLFPLP
ncbi:MAG: ribonuclease HII [Verrucomicrobiota bacterium]|nr:ribonuclease HII [Verrucomicrobiota bacterium]